MDWKRRLKQKGRKKKKLHTKIPTSKGRHVTVSNLVEALWGTNCPRYGNNLVIGPHVGIVLVCKACIGQDGVTAVCRSGGFCRHGLLTPPTPVLSAPEKFKDSPALIASLPTGFNPKVT